MAALVKGGATQVAVTLDGLVCDVVDTDALAMGGVMVTVKQYQRETEPRALLEGHHYPDGQQRNVSEDERVISVAGGTFLGALGVSQRGLPGLLLAGLGVALFYRGATGACPAYKALGVDTARRQSGVDVNEAFTIDKPAEQLYQFWRDFENLPRIMSHVRSVKTLEDGRLRWVDRAPSVTGGTVEWDAEILEDIPNERIAWQSLPGGDVDNAGLVTFEPGPRGTTVRVSLCYVPPGGHLGQWLASAFGENPKHQIREDLRSFKRIMEVGEVPTTKGQPHGSCTSLGNRLFQ